jgi:hypothetical protein
MIWVNSGFRNLFNRPVCRQDMGKLAPWRKSRVPLEQTMSCCSQNYFISPYISLVIHILCRGLFVNLFLLYTTSNHVKEESMLQRFLCSNLTGLLWCIILFKKSAPMASRVGTREAKSTSRKWIGQKIWYVVMNVFLAGSVLVMVYIPYASLEACDLA